MAPVVLKTFKGEGRQASVRVQIMHFGRPPLLLSVSKRYQDKETGQWKDGFYYPSDAECLLELVKQAIDERSRLEELPFSSLQAEERPKKVSDQQEQMSAEGGGIRQAQEDDDDIPF